VPGDTSSRPPLQIGLPTLLPRSPVLLPPILERAVGSLPVEAPVLSAPFSLPMGVLTRDHPPPVREISFPPASPRSPPRSAEGTRSAVREQRSATDEAESGWRG
jgi:hypothetical protein